MCVVILCVGLDEFYEIVDVGGGNVEDIDEGGTIDIVVNDLGKGIDVFWCVAEVWVEHTDGEASGCVGGHTALAMLAGG